MKDKNRYYRLRSQVDSLQLHILENDVIIREAVLDTSVAGVARDCFNDDIPADRDVELAIYQVEQAIMVVQDIIGPQPTDLYCDDPLMPVTFNEIADGVVSADDLELLNYRYADYIAGVPERQLGIEFSAQKFSLILILREMAHHLNFTRFIFNPG